MYGIRGERQLLEWEVDGLPGYEGSKPVHIGNAAAGQLQLDVYGEVADAFFQGHLGGIPGPETSFALQRALTDHLATCWNLPDQGIWEVRGEPQHFTYSKVMAWVAFDRSIKTSEKFGLQGEVDQWRALRQQIHDDTCERGYDPNLGSFVQAYGSKEMDAPLLLMPLVRFLPWNDERIRSTVEAIQKHLLVDGFVLRYRTERVDDGLPVGDGVFLASSFLMVSALQILGREDEARSMFDRLLELRNDVGLLAEEYDPRAQRQLGNFPQALPHIALINAAFEFVRATTPGRQRAEASSAQPEGRGTGADSGT
jgi:GH15 family glucan-1,4-alpha-glucosidase